MVLPLTSGIYQHYKGPFYRLYGIAVTALKDDFRGIPVQFIGLAHHSDTGETIEIGSSYIDLTRGDLLAFRRDKPFERVGEQLAFYHALHEGEGPRMAVRPLDDFVGQVEHLGDMVPRFRWVANTTLELP